MSLLLLLLIGVAIFLAGMKTEYILRQHHNAKRQSVKGFTLIELLVVIAIIGLLSTVIVTPIRDAMREAKCQKAHNCPVVKIEDECEQYKNDSIRYVPVKCYGYFHINAAVDVNDK